MQIYWFRNNHEFRNHYFQFALMRLHLRGRIGYHELDLAAGRDFGLPESLVSHDHRHTSVLVAERDGRRRTIFIDNEDGFTHLTPFVRDVDVYFCCAYASAFHEHRQFVEPLPWQTEGDVATYRAEAADLVARYGEHFGKIRRLTPTPTHSAVYDSVPPEDRKRLTYAHRARKLAVWRRDRQLWKTMYALYEARYNELLGNRRLPLRYDVVSRESLWGWPNNRIVLHRRLREIADGRKVYTQLVPLDPTKNDLTRAELAVSPDHLPHLPALQAPLALADPFERALCSSRLGVFPTGYHWGWRGIVFVALCAGVPILMDRPLYEPYFDFTEFRLFFNENGWEQVGELLETIDEGRWAEIKAHNQRVFDRYLAPDAVGDYLEAEIGRSLDA